MNSLSVNGKKWVLSKYNQKDLAFIKETFSLDEITSKLLSIRNIKKDKSKVPLLIGNGSGHEPIAVGWVGEGLLDANVVGDIFAAPSGDQIFEGIKLFQSHSGIILLISNHSGDVMNGEMAIELADDENRNYLLKQYIEEIKDNYDYIFIDTPPTLGLLTISSLTASDEVLIPVQCEFFALEGLSKLIKTIEIVKSNLNSNLKLNGIILTMYDKRNSLSSLIEKEAREYFEMNVYKFNVPRNVTLSEAPSHGLPAIIYDLKCAGSQAYIALAKEFLERSANNGNQ